MRLRRRLIINGEYYDDDDDDDDDVAYFMALSDISSGRGGGVRCKYMSLDIRDSDLKQGPSE
jgi:hypothetical protein